MVLAGRGRRLRELLGSPSGSLSRRDTPGIWLPALVPSRSLRLPSTQSQQSCLALGPHDDRHFRAEGGRAALWMIDRAVPRSPMPCVPPDNPHAATVPRFLPTTGASLDRRPIFLFLAGRSLLKFKTDGISGCFRIPRYSGFQVVDSAANNTQVQFGRLGGSSQQSLMLFDTFPFQLMAHESVALYA